MINLLRYLVGPEVIWIAACLWSGTLKGINTTRGGALNQLIASYATYVPALLMILTVALFAIPFAGKKLLLLRIILVGLIGTHFLLQNILNAHTEGGPGVGTIYIVGYLLMPVAIIVSVLVKVFVFK